MLRMRWMTILAVLAGVVPAEPQVSEDIITDYVGNWLVLPVDGRSGCIIALTAEETIGGRLAIPADDCSQHVPEIVDASAWYPNEGVSFTDPIRQPVLAFSEDETALLSSPNVADPRLYLVPAKAGLTHVPMATAMAGNWILAKSEGEPLCELILEKPGSGDAAVLRVAKTCPKSALPPGLKRWRMEALNLYLEGNNDAAVALQPETDDRFASEDGSLTLRRAAAKAQ